MYMFYSKNHIFTNHVFVMVYFVYIIQHKSTLCAICTVYYILNYLNIYYTLHTNLNCCVAVFHKSLRPRFTAFINTGVSYVFVNYLHISPENTNHRNEIQYSPQYSSIITSQ